MKQAGINPGLAVMMEECVRYHTRLLICITVETKWKDNLGEEDNIYGMNK